MKKQNPAAFAHPEWCPGGLTMQNAVSTIPEQTALAPSTVPPAETNALYAVNLFS